MKEAFDKYYDNFVRFNKPDKKTFDHASRLYNAWYGKYLPSNKFAKILDVGCGMGHFMYMLRDLAYVNYLGVDISQKQVDFVKQNITDRAVCCDIFNFYLEPDSYDLIMANDLIEHIPKNKILKLLHLFYDSLKTGGRLIVKTDNLANPFNLKGRYGDFTHQIGFTESSLSQVLGIARFQNIEMFGSYNSVWYVRAITKVPFTLIRYLYRTQDLPMPNILNKDLIAIGTK